MYLMYFDETGDTGLHNSPTSYFGLSGLVVHESDWRRFINDLVAFRKTLRSTYGLPVRAEIHAAEFMSKRVHGLEKFERLAILRNTLDELAKLNYISVTNVIVHKVGKPPDYDVFLKAWQTLFQPTFPRWLPNSAPMVAKQAPFWNHERHFHPLDRTFDDRMTFCTLFRLDFSSFGHTSPVIISAFHRSACRNGRWSQFIDQP